MSTSTERFQRLADEIFATWNTQDIDAVLARYVDDLVYLDPNTRGPVVGREAMRAYLTSLFSRWTMRWQGGELFPHARLDAVTIRWSGMLALVGETRSVEIAGLDLVILEGDLVKRNEVYFDRSPLAALLS